jgi:hypothetical protein
MASFIGVEEDENIVYADDSNVWQTGSTKEDVARKLTEKATLFVEYTQKRGLSMNASKTQLLFSSRAGNVTETLVEVDRSVIHPVDTIELLGVRYDRKLSTGPHIKALLAAVRQRASVISRLANHLPRPASRAQTGWWSRPSQPRRGDAFTATTGKTVPVTTTADSSSRTGGRAWRRLRGRRRPGWSKSL